MFRAAYGRGRLQELFITKFKSQFKQGFTKVVISRAGCLRERLLNFLSFPPSSVMILLAFLACFLSSLFFVKNLFFFKKNQLSLFVISSGKFNCPRQVTTIVCAHEPDCVPSNCNGHGQCVMGRCVCDSQWTGESCDVVKCKENNCSSNGVCSQQGESRQAILYVDSVWKLSWIMCLIAISIEWYMKASCSNISPVVVIFVIMHGSFYLLHHWFSQRECLATQKYSLCV